MNRTRRLEFAAHQTHLIHDKARQIEVVLQRRDSLRAAETAKRDVGQKSIARTFAHVAGQPRGQAAMQLQQRRRSIRLRRHQPRRGATTIGQADQAKRRERKTCQTSGGALHRFNRRVKLSRRRVADELKRQVNLSRRR